MQLTRFTDIGVRVLMYLSYTERDDPVTISEIATSFDISRNHLVKVVHFLSQGGWIVSTRGKGGGIGLSQPAAQYRLGRLIRELESHTELIDCASPPCTLRGQCQLKGILEEALLSFYEALDAFTLADAVAGPTHEAIVTLHHMGVRSVSPRPSTLAP